MLPLNKNSLLKFLLFSNAVTSILLLFVLIREGYTIRIMNRLRSTSEEIKVTSTNSELKKMNNVFTPLFTDTVSEKRGGGGEYKILIIGNSLTKHEIAKEIGWTHISGMAATAKNKDYAHLIFNHLKEELPNSRIAMRLSNFADFERHPSSLNKNSLDSLVSFNPNLVIYQLGENVVIGDTGIFRTKYIEMINYTKNNSKAVTICTTPFFPSVEKNEIINKVAIATNSYLVDLSHLPLLNERDYAKNEKDYQGDKTIWKNEGIGIHPGDIGMRDIADQLLITINAVLAESHE